MQLPVTWSEFRDTRRRMLAYTLQDVDQVGIEVNVMQSTGYDEALRDADVFCTEFGPTEVPRFPAHRHHAVILPISGKKLKFTIAGTRFTVDAYAGSTASSAPTAMSCMLRSNLAS